MKEISKSKKKTFHVNGFMLSLLVLVTVLSSWGCNVERSVPEQPEGRARQSGTFNKTIEYDGLRRTYIVHVPPGTSVDETVPLVVVIHGANGTARVMLENDDVNMRAKADLEKFVVLYPEGTPNAQEPNFSWNAVHCCDDAWENGVDDVGFIDHLLDLVMNEYHIDDTRVYVTGFSNGGMLSHRLGAELGHRFAAIAPVAGTIGGNPLPDQDRLIIPTPVQPLAVMIIHGFQDTEVPYLGGAYYGNYRRLDISAPESALFWAQRNGCSPTPQVEDGGTEYLKQTFRPENGDTNREVILYTLHREGHVWPYSINDTPTSDILWNFFKDKTNSN